MKNKSFLIATTAIVLLLNSSILYSQHHEEENSHATTDHFYKNHIAIFNGSTTVLEHELTSYTFGIEYEYRFTKTIGLGVLGEYLTPETVEFVVGVPFFIHPFKELKLVAAPLIVYGEEHQEEQTHESKKEAHLFGRIGIGYEFHAHHFSIDPIVNFDFGKTEAFDYGVAIGYGF